MTELLVSCAVTLVAAPVVRRLMLHRGVMDFPNHRSSHSMPTPRGGGLACLLGVLVGLAAAAVRAVEVPWVLVGGAVLLSAVGYADDQRDLSALSRLGGQLLTGAVMGLAVGGTWWAAALGAVFVPASVNVVNFMDGINGITALTMGLWGATALLLGRLQGIEPLWALGAVACGAALGFLPWNVPAARLFLGDAGSYLFGGLVAAGLLVGWAEGAPVPVLLAPLTIYLLDTGSTLLRRASRGERLMTAHREHIYQRLVRDGGLSHVAVAGGCAVLAALVTVAALASPVWGLLGVAAVSALYLGATRLVRWSRPDLRTLAGGGAS